MPGSCSHCNTTPNSGIALAEQGRSSFSALLLDLPQKAFPGMHVAWAVVSSQATRATASCLRLCLQRSLKDLYSKKNSDPVLSWKQQEIAKANDAALTNARKAFTRVYE